MDKRLGTPTTLSAVVQWETRYGVIHREARRHLRQGPSSPLVGGGKSGNPDKLINDKKEQLGKSLVKVINNCEELERLIKQRLKRRLKHKLDQEHKKIPDDYVTVRGMIKNRFKNRRESSQHHDDIDKDTIFLQKVETLLKHTIEPSKRTPLTKKFEKKYKDPHSVGRDWETVPYFYSSGANEEAVGQLKMESSIGGEYGGDYGGDKYIDNNPLFLQLNEEAVGQESSIGGEYGGDYGGDNDARANGAHDYSEGDNDYSSEEHIDNNPLFVQLNEEAVGADDYSEGDNDYSSMRKP